MSRPMSTTSHAILGLLAIRSWTPYEMAQQMRFSLGRFWPRAASKLYEEPKKLVRLGFAAATTETTGDRLRTRYDITEEGRAALRAWLKTPPMMPSLDAEPLLRVFLAEHGTRADLVAVLEGVAAWSAEWLVEDARIADAYLNGEGQFPARIPQLTLVGRFLSDFALMTHEWADSALRTVQTWPDDVRRAQADRDTLENIVSRAERLAE